MAWPDRPANFHSGMPMPQPYHATLVATTSSMPKPNSRHQDSDNRHVRPASSHTATAMPSGPVTLMLPSTDSVIHHHIIRSIPRDCLHCPAALPCYTMHD